MPTDETSHDMDIIHIDSGYGFYLVTLGHFLNQCWHIVNMTIKARDKLHWNWSQNTKSSSTKFHLDISRTSVANKIVDHSDVVGVSPVGAAPTTSSFST